MLLIFGNPKNNLLKHFITLKNLIPNYKKVINQQVLLNDDYKLIQSYLLNNFNIQSSIDSDIVNPYSRDWSNIPGNADMLIKPKNSKECSIIFQLCYKNKIPITLSAGKTNLTGSATPKGGIILSIEQLSNPGIHVDNNLKEVTCPVGIPLEDVRKKVLEDSKKKLYYPVDPTSRNDAFVGGTIACNASGFMPGEKGATRYWVNEVEFLFPCGYYINARRGDYISKDGNFKFNIDDKEINFPIPTYKRPKIKNASGPYSSDSGEVDFVDLIIGSEGIFGMILSCKLKLADRPKDYLELFLCLENEEKAIDFHDFLFDCFKGDMSKISALEYFGYNSQTYMKHRNFLFKSSSDVGIYIQIPIHKETVESKSIEWIDLINRFDSSIDIDSIIVLNDPLNWKKFFEARHSIPDNALTKTRELGGVSIITDAIVPPENYRKYLQLIHKKLQEANIEYLLFGHLGDCHLHFHLIPTDSQDDNCLEIYDYMIDLSTELGGVYSAEHGTGKRKRNDFRKCYGEKAVEMVRQSKLVVDPDLILNRGNVFN